MARLDPAASARWVARRAKATASSLKSEYESGKRGDDSPTTPIFPSPKEQLEALGRLLGLGHPTAANEVLPTSGPSERELPTSEPAALELPTSALSSSEPGVHDPLVAVGGVGSNPADTGAAGVDERAEAPEVSAVAGALRSIDWAQVKSATAERTSDAAKAMRTMAEQVDWSKAQPIAAQVSSALIAAVASGRLPVAGPLGPTIARALSDKGALSQRIGQSLVDQQESLPPDFRPALEHPEP